MCAQPLVHPQRGHTFSTTQLMWLLVPYNTQQLVPKYRSGTVAHNSTIEIIRYEPGQPPIELKRVRSNLLLWDWSCACSLDNVRIGQEAFFGIFH